MNFKAQCRENAKKEVFRRRCLAEEVAEERKEKLAKVHFESKSSEESS